MKRMGSYIGSNLRKNIIAGIVILIPLIATVWILRWLFEIVDSILSPVIEAIFGHPVPGIGFGVFIIIIYLTGAFTANVLGKQLFNRMENNIERIPLVKEVYSPLRQVMDSLTFTQKGSFKEVVLLDFPRKGIKAIGFVTRRICDPSGKEMLNVYVPTAPNPTSGFLQLVSPESVTKTDITVEDGMKLIISAGVVSPSVINLGDETIDY